MELLTQVILTHHRCEFAFPVPEGMADKGLNIFDTRDVILEAEITRPDGSKDQSLGFAYRAHQLDPVADQPKAIERAIPTGEIEFRLRYAPTVPGTHHIQAWYRFGNGERQPCGEAKFDAAASAHSGYIRISENGYTFHTESGEAFYPIGSNLCWPNLSAPFPGQKLADMQTMMTSLAECGGTAFRLWANSPWAHAIDWSGKEEEDCLKFGEINLSGCAKLDVVVETAEALGLRIMFAIDAANNWAKNHLGGTPYSVQNGGPCETTADYFNMPEARAMTREKMKYVAARWGYSTSVWCWEFWNEVNGCGIDSVNAHQQLTWHEEMSRVLREADTVKHIITTSTGHPLHFQPMWRLPEMEFTQSHHYGYHDGVDDIGTLLKGFHESSVALHRKPHIASEVGTCFASNQEIWDTDGSTFHLALWSATLLPHACGPAFFWFWDSYIHQLDLYPHYTGIARFLKDERWHEVDTEALQISFVNSPPMVLDPPVTMKVPTTMSGSEYFQSVFELPNDGVVPNVHLIPNTYYGSDRHLLQFRTTYVVDYPMDGEFTSRVWSADVSCNGIVNDIENNSEPIAEIHIDGKLALRQIAHGAKNGSHYGDNLTVSVPAGRHEISLTNVGEGLFVTGHLLLTNYQTTKHPLAVQGLRYPGHACFWIRNRDYNWTAAKKGIEIQPTTDLEIQIEDLEPGSYQVEWWDTVQGEVVSTASATVNNDGILRAAAPTFVNDIAGKCRRVG